MVGSKPGRKLPPRREDLTGHRFGRFTVVRFADVRGGSARWACQCDCGGDAATNARDREARGRGNSRRKAASELEL